MLRAAIIVGVLAVGGVVGATRVLGTDNSQPLGSRSQATATPSPSPSPTPFGPQVIPTGGPTDPAALLTQLLVTYAPGSPCASVQVETPIAKVPKACADVWAPYHVLTVPGQDAVKRTPRFPQVTAAAGVSPQDAIKLAVALWRTKTFQAFALGTRQVRIEAGLSENEIFLRAGREELAVMNGARVSTPLCHFFPTEIRVMPLASDFEGFVHRTGRVLGVKARFQGPCYATETTKQGVTRQIFSFNGADDVVFVGDIRSGDPLGAVLDVTGLGDCSADITKATCAA